ncbi:MAG: type IX secretion system outer membrane channel protein PorV [Ignavibacteriaceae bacterium]
MKIILRLLMVSMMFLILQKTIFAQGETAVPFLLVAPDSRAGAMGESGAGLADNSAAIYWNPAGIAFTKTDEVSITHSRWLPQFNLDIFYDYLTYMQYVPDISGSLTASLTYMNYGQFIRTGPDSPTPIGTFTSFDAAMTVGYATRLSDDWGLGVNFRLIYSRLSDQPTSLEQGRGVATSVSFDVGGMWRPARLILPLLNTDIGGKLSIGLNLSNLGPKMYYIDRAQADPIPSNFRLGFAYEVFKDEYNSFVYTVDFNKLLVSKKDSITSYEFYQSLYISLTDQSFSNELTTIQTSMGVEYWYGKPGDFLFAIRAGFFYEDPNHGNRKFITFGAGIRYDIYGFDFSYISTSVFSGGETSPLANTLRFTLSVGWGGSATTYRGIPRGI